MLAYIIIAGTYIFSSTTLCTSCSVVEIRINTDIPTYKQLTFNTLISLKYSLRLYERALTANLKNTYQ